MMASLHQRCPVGCLCHTQGTQSQETHYCCQILPKIISRRILLGWFCPSTQTLSHAQKTTPTRETSFPDLGDHSHHYFHSFLLMTCFVLCHQIHLTKHEERKKRTGNMIIKTRKRKTRVKSDFLPWKIDEQLKQRNQKKQLEKTEGLFIFFLKEQKKKDRDGLMQRMSRGRDQWRLNVHGLNSLNNVTARSNGEESLQSCMRSSTHVNLEISCFFVSKKKEKCSYFLKKISNDKPTLWTEKKIVQHISLFQKNVQKDKSL